MYEVIHYFTDLQDNGYPYNAGDVFPRDGLAVSEERLKELSSINNRQHKPLIRLVVEQKEEMIPFSDSDDEFDKEEHQYTKSEINRMSTSDLQKLATTEGVENAYGISGGELKKILIQHFNL